MNVLRPIVGLRVWAPWSPALAILLGLCLWATPASAQQGAAAEYQVYSLKHKSPADVEKVLADMLGGMGESTHVVADAKKNQILVRGPEKAQQVVRDLIASIDQPREGPAVEPKLVVKTYRCDSGRRAEVLARLRSDYDSRQLRAAVDPESGNLVVLASEAIHQRIASLIPSEDAVRGSAAAADAPADEQSIKLTHLQAAELETTLREQFRERLLPDDAGRPGPAKYRFIAPRSGSVVVSIDRQGRRVTVAGTGRLVQQWVQLIRSLDSPVPAEDRSIQVVPLRYADPQKVQEAVEAYRGKAGDAPRPLRALPRGQGRLFDHNGVELASYLFQAKAAAAPADAPAAKPEQPPAKAEGEPEDQRLRVLREIGLDVDIETLPDLGAIIIRGRKRDVEEVRRIIAEIERLSTETEPAIEVLQLRHIQGDALSEIIRQVQADVIAGRQGRVTILPLGKPNALLLIGWGEAVKKAKELIARLDQPADPRERHRVFPLRHAAASSVAQAISQFFATGSGLEPRVRATADPRSNSLVVQAAPRDMQEVELLLEKLDVPGSAAVFRTQIFKLSNTLANDVYATLQNAIDAARAGAAGRTSAGLELLSVDPADPNRQRLLKSGVLNEVRVTPDPRLNILIVAAPPESMDLLAALIRELDSPGAVAQIKVFRIVNGDANTMVQTLRGLVPAVGGPQLSVAEGEPSTMGLRFSVDMRTNSVIAIGSTGDLRIVEALILRLDALDGQQRKTVVYRLKNAPAPDVSNAVNRFLSTERQVQMAAPGAFNAFQQIESEVVVVPEPVSNALIISATPRFFEEISQLVEKLDAQPSQVMIQVLIAEVSLRNTDEFGVELGLQDSMLFDRSVLAGNLTTQTNTQQQSTPAGIITATEQSFPAATLNPGYLFNSPILGNGATGRENSNRVGGQGLSNLAVGRINNELGFGGLVLSASSESVSVLIRALQESQRLEVLGRPHIMTLDNQPAFIQIGKRVPRITGSMAPTLGTGQVFNTFELVNVGLILGVTPRISPEGMVVMEIDAEKSELGPEGEGVPVSISEGTVIRSPTFNTTMAQTTVSAASGETIVLGGLITKSNSNIERKVPYIADIPILGQLFKYHSTQCRRTELLIVLTPHVVRNQEDMERIKRVESARMHWCLQSVNELHCDGGLTSAKDAAEVIYPDSMPRGVPSGQGPPAFPEPIPAPLPQDNRGTRTLGPRPGPQQISTREPATSGPPNDRRPREAPLAAWAEDPAARISASGDSAVQPATYPSSLGDPRSGVAPARYEQPINPYAPATGTPAAPPYPQAVPPSYVDPLPVRRD